MENIKASYLSLGQGELIAADHYGYIYVSVYIYTCVMHSEGYDLLYSHQNKSFDFWTSEKLASQTAPVPGSRAKVSHHRDLHCSNWVAASSRQRWCHG